MNWSPKPIRWSAAEEHDIDPDRASRTMSLRRLPSSVRPVGTGGIHEHQLVAPVHDAADVVARRFGAA